MFLYYEVYPLYVLVLWGLSTLCSCIIVYFYTWKDNANFELIFARIFTGQFYR